MIRIENSRFVLTLSDDCLAQSLVVKATGEECLQEQTPLFTLTQDRPYNNEIKLIYPNKQTTFPANRIRREGDRLIVGFELVAFEAVIQLQENEDFIGFELAEILIPEDAYGVGCRRIDPAPIAQLRMLQLSLKKRENFGNWLNVVWDAPAAVGVVGTSPYAMPDAQVQKDAYLLYADLSREVKLDGAGAALVACPADGFLDCMQSLEEYYHLPNGVKNRRCQGIDQSIYWTTNLCPANVDEHIAYAKKCGLKKMTLFIGSFMEAHAYSYNNEVRFNSRYPNGKEDLKLVLDKIREAGIVPGIHFLHTHIGLKTHYVTPVADHRLNLTRHFTLARALGEQDEVIYVEEDPTGAPKTDCFRVLKFNGELIQYEGYTTQYPYCFTGCKRGHCDTTVRSHELGTIGGVLDITEFGGSSAYINQHTSLQDEIAQQLADIYDMGFEYIYFDGSEGVNPPFAFHVPNAQYRVYKKLKKEPLFCEGAAKAHFGWHMLSGGNAFDVFPTAVFKEKIVEFPMVGAARLAKDFTRLNFGWWNFNERIQPDLYEFGMSKAAAFNCAATVMFKLQTVDENPRVDDVCEVLRRWEDVKDKKWLTPAQKEMLKAPDREFILLINEEGEYELVPYYPIKTQEEDLLAFWFERKGKTYAVCWHRKGQSQLKLSWDTPDFAYQDQLGGPAVETKTADGQLCLPLGKRRYFSTTQPKEKLIQAFENARLSE